MSNVYIRYRAADTTLTFTGYSIAVNESALTLNNVGGTLSPTKGGTGVANNAASTLTISGAFATTLTVSGITALTLPTAGTVATLSNNLGQFASTTSAQLASTISDETGTGALTFATNPVLVTPNLGTPSAGVLTSCTGLPLTTGVTGVLGAANGGTGVANNAAATLTRSGNHDLTLTTTATTSLALPTTGTLATLAGAETLTNKILSGNTASNFINTGTITLPTTTTTLAGLAVTPQTFTGSNIFTGDTGVGDAGASPAYRLDLKSTAASSSLFRAMLQFNGAMAFDLVHHRNSAASPDMRVQLTSSRGTIATPAQIKSTDNLSTIYFRGYDNAGTPAPQVGAQLGVSALEDFTATAAGSKVSLSVSAVGSVAPSEVLSAKVTGVAIKGTTTNDNATAGFIGETMENHQTGANQVNIATSGTAVNVFTASSSNGATSITLTAGDWMISGQISYNQNAAATTTARLSAISKSSGALPAGTTLVNRSANGETYSQSQTTIVGAVDHTEIISPIRVSLSSASTPYYLVGFANFTGVGASVNVSGSLIAVRIR